ncbi:MAG: glucose 1-dehydrogenase [Pseudomonadota bacterium]
MAETTPVHALFDLSGKVALVTGASKGIGESIAMALAEFGARVVVNSRKQDAINAVVRSIKDRGYEATAIAGNVGNIENIEWLLDTTVDTYGGIDILVNNAATNPVFGPIEASDEGVFDKVIDVNLKAPFELGKRAQSLMKARGGGSIINISSIGGLTPEPGIGLYSVSKAAIISMTQAMAQDWGKDNIRVNAICPGLIKTKFSEALWQDENILEGFLNQIPLGRIGEPQDIAGLAVFLASPASAYCSGGYYLVDGGYSAS